MKDFKQAIIEKMIEKHSELKIVSLRDVAAELGVHHISRQDTADIAKALEQVHGAKLIRIMGSENDSLFQSICLADEDVEFDEGGEL